MFLENLNSERATVKSSHKDHVYLFVLSQATQQLADMLKHKRFDYTFGSNPTDELKSLEQDFSTALPLCSRTPITAKDPVFFVLGIN